MFLAKPGNPGNPEGKLGVLLSLEQNDGCWEESYGYWRQSEFSVAQSSAQTRSRFSSLLILHLYKVRSPSYVAVGL